jgi:hypothetical protein
LPPADTFVVALVFTGITWPLTFIVAPELLCDTGPEYDGPLSQTVLPLPIVCGPYQVSPVFGLVHDSIEPDCNAPNIQPGILYLPVAAWLCVSVMVGWF